MADARDRRERDVRVAALFGGGFAISTCFFASPALAEGAQGGATGSASISLGGGEPGASQSGEGPPQADAPRAEEPIDPRIKNPANYEFAFVSLAAYQTWSLSGHVLYFGAGGGPCPAPLPISQHRD